MRLVFEVFLIFFGVVWYAEKVVWYATLNTSWYFLSHFDVIRRVGIHSDFSFDWKTTILNPKIMWIDLSLAPKSTWRPPFKRDRSHLPDSAYSETILDPMDPK